MGKAHSVNKTIQVSFHFVLKWLSVTENTPSFHSINEIYFSYGSQLANDKKAVCTYYLFLYLVVFDCTNFFLHNHACYTGIVVHVYM